ncbi:MAG: peptidase M61 [Bacteroidota bacterium]
MKFFLSSLFGLLLFSSAIAQQELVYKVDLNQISNDQFVVELTPPKFSGKETTFHLPKIVPGTYDIYDFGRFVSNFKAFDKKGKELKVRHPDDNTWIISKPKKLAKIVYSVEDTWDTRLGNKVFEPGGTNIEKERNFVFNNHGFFGYFKDAPRLPIRLIVERPADFFGATTLLRDGGDEDTDVFVSENYNDFVDHPIMFCKPDTVVLKIGNADVLISTYSPTNRVTSEFLAGEIGPILEGLLTYLGGTLPVDRYAFLVYLTDGFTASGGYGALEHNYSSMYVLPEMAPEQIAQTVRDVSAHEFYHIVTPLNIHSEEIRYFDFINPKMSKHLWLYEGVTEYAAGHVQVHQRLMPIENYLDVIAEKVRGAEQYTDDLPFTEMSEGCLDEHKEEYLNVYQKGALIGMCLDLELLIHSEGEYSLQDLMNDLTEEYGKDKPFKDDELFDKIVSFSGKEVGDFLNTHVAGPEPLPIQELLKAAGIDYYPVKKIKERTLGGLENAIGFNPGTGQFFIQNADLLDDFGKSIGLQSKDVLLKWNDDALSLENINAVFTNYMINGKEGDDLSVVVERAGEEVELKSVISTVEVEVKHAFDLTENPTDAQMALRKAWLGDYRMAGEDMPDGDNSDSK